MLTQGKMAKGGLNEKPKSERPPPPPQQKRIKKEVNKCFLETYLKMKC